MTMKDIKKWDKDQLLDMLGFETRSSKVLRMIGLLAIGGLVGTVLTLLFAPRSGRVLREDLAQKIKESTNEVVAAMKNKAAEIQPSMK